MRFPRTKSKREGASEAVRKSALAARENREALLKMGLVAVGAAALTAGSAAISSLRQRIEMSS